jgi:DNA-binding IclR family transcriptional regulator
MTDEDPDLTALESEILDYLLLDGANGPAGIADALDRPPESISRSLKNLRVDGWIMDKGGGVWTLSNAGLHLARLQRRADTDRDESE